MRKVKPCNPVELPLLNPNTIPREESLNEVTRRNEAAGRWSAAGLSLASADWRLPPAGKDG